MTDVRINKLLADKGICSRRKADEHILRGEVLINGKPAKLGDKADLQNDTVSFKGNNISSERTDFEYWAIYKPKGVISTSKDERGRKTVVEIVQSKARLYPVGRLDETSEGLIILTNDGEIANLISHPSHNHIKSYSVLAIPSRRSSLGWIEKKLCDGFKIDGKLMKAEKATATKNNNLISLELDLATGYNRQIRRMCDKIGLQVVKLVRTKIGKLELESLKLSSGEFTKIKREDIL